MTHTTYTIGQFEVTPTGVKTIEIRNSGVAVPTQVVMADVRKGAHTAKIEIIACEIVVVEGGKWFEGAIAKASKEARKSGRVSIETVVTETL